MITPSVFDNACFGYRCAPAATMLQTNGDLKRKWTWAVYWLNDELERVRERERDSVSVRERVPVCVGYNTGGLQPTCICLIYFRLFFWGG